MSTTRLAELQQKIWNGNLPLELRLAASDCRTYAESEPYLVQPTRLSYLAFLLPKLHAFFSPSLIEPDVSPHDAWLSFEDVPLKWHYPLGLLFDLFSGADPIDLDGQRSHEPTISQGAAQPWRLIVHYTDYPGDQLIQLDADGRALLDSYINAVKEADFIRNGSARTVMSLNDLTLFNTINNKLLNPPGMEIRHIPIKVYLPTSAAQTASDTIAEDNKMSGHIRVVQALVPLQLPSKQPQTLGTALNGILPSIFPSRRNPLLAQPVLHGVMVPLAAPVEDLSRAAAYADGFLHVTITMLG